MTGFLADLTPFASGHTFLSFLGVGDSIKRIRAAFADDKWEALQKLKRQYDPKHQLMSYMNIPTGK